MFISAAVSNIHLQLIYGPRVSSVIGEFILIKDTLEFRIGPTMSMWTSSAADLKTHVIYRKSFFDC